MFPKLEATVGLIFPFVQVMPISAPLQHSHWWHQHCRIITDAIPCAKDPICNSSLQHSHWWHQHCRIITDTIPCAKDPICNSSVCPNCTKNYHQLVEIFYLICYNFARNWSSVFISLDLIAWHPMRERFSSLLPSLMHSCLRCVLSCLSFCM